MAVKKSQLYSSLWASCDKLRGGMDASQYKDYILTLLFVKYVSDKYKDDPYGAIAIPEGSSFEDLVALKGNKNIGEEIDAGFLLNCVDGCDKTGITLAVMRLVGKEVRAAAGGGHGPGCVEGALHQEFVEVAGHRNTANGGGVLVQGPDDNIQGVTAGRGMADHCILQGIPYAVIKPVLILECLVGVVEGLLVAVAARLTIVGRDKVAAAVIAAGRLLLPVGAEGGILVPAAGTP